MSGIVKGIGKIFHAVGKVVTGVFHAVKKVVVDLWHIPIIRYAAIAVAAYFTAGAAMAYFGGAAAAGGTAAVDVGALSTGAGVGSAALAPVADIGAGAISSVAIPSAVSAAAAGAAGAGAAAAGLAGAVTLPTVDVVGTYLGDAAIPAFSGQAVGAAAAIGGATGAVVSSATAAGSMPADAPQQSVEDASNQASDQYAQQGSPDAGNASFGQQAQNDVSSFYSNDTTSIPATSDTSASSSNGLLSPNTAYTGPDAVTPPADAGAGATPAESGNIVTRALHGVGNLAKDAWNTFDNASATTKLSLLSTALQVGSALLAKPQPQMQFAGVNDKGYGPGTLIHTTNNGFGLGVGGGQQAPTGVPSSLLPPSSAPSAPQLATAGNPGASPTLPGLASAPSTIKAPAAAPAFTG